MCFPEEGLVYDYRLDDAGISNFEDDEEEGERKVRQITWIHMDSTSDSLLLIHSFTFLPVV